METKKNLYRDTDNKMLGGVASGLAVYMGWDVTLVRLALLFCLFAVQGSVLAYILAWIIIPSKYSTSQSFSFGKILLLLFICFLPILLTIAFISLIIFGSIIPFL